MISSAWHPMSENAQRPLRGASGCVLTHECQPRQAPPRGFAFGAVRDTAIQDVGPSYAHGDEAGVQLPVKRTSRLAAYPSLGIRET